MNAFSMSIAFLMALPRKICFLALSFESVMFKPHFTSGSGLFGKNNNRGTYIDQRDCSLAATHSGWMINGSCFGGLDVHSATSQRFLQTIAGTSGKME